MSQRWHPEITDILGVWWNDICCCIYCPSFSFTKCPLIINGLLSAQTSISNMNLALQNSTKTARWQLLCRLRRLIVASRRLQLLQVHRWVYPDQLHRQLLRPQQDVSTEAGISRVAHQQNGAAIHGGSLCPVLQEEGQQDDSRPPQHWSNRLF